MKKFLKQNKLLLFITILFIAVSSLSYVFIAILLQKIMDIVMAGDVEKFMKTITLSLIYFALMGIFTYLQSLFSKRFICKIMKSVRSKTFKGIEHHSIEAFNKSNTAEYLSAITNDVKMVEDNYLLPLLEIIQYSIIFISSLAVMIYFDVIVTVCVIISISLMFIVPSLFGGPMSKRQNAYSQKLAVFTENVKDLLSGFEVIKSYRMQKYVISKFEESNKNTLDAKYSVDKMIAANESVSMILAILIQVVVLFLSAYFIIIGRITAGALLGMIQVSANLSNPLLMIFSNLPKLKSITPIVKRLNELSEYKNKDFIGDKQPEFKNAVTIESLKFSYDNERPVLNDISLRIERGKKYALVGKSGCGKSTLIKIISGYYSEYEGRITYDKINISDLDINKISELSSIIHQNIYMFNESIYDNICLHENFTEQEIQEALEASGVSQFIKQIPEELSYIVGENGSNLSGGQKQRIAVARALIRKKPILILDEGTSAIDMQTAYDIESQLLKLKEMTLLTITHNMSKDILELYDEVIFMEEGKIIEKASFSELAAKEGAFFQFYKLKK